MVEPRVSVTATGPGWPLNACVCPSSSVWSILDSGGNSGTANAAAIIEEGVVDGEMEVELLSFNTDFRPSGGGGGVLSGSSVSVGSTNTPSMGGKCLDLPFFSAAMVAVGPP